jgi:hypothetical protein
VTQFNIYLMSGDEEETVGAYGRDIVPPGPSACA